MRDAEMLFGDRVSVIVRSSTEAGLATLTVPPSGVDLEAVERALLAFALESTAGNRTQAAKLLGLTRSALLYRLQKHGLRSVQAAASTAMSRAPLSVFKQL